ncbi:GNAT family N-acetyltransferase [Yinghuangia seranimata]|uniref:GNAT family N-acetyltransferase n=1 Tax=Yinghuangia seranimata TaxID=408067 RepID=UPI00248CC88E|nr:GNAT family N-acetyltransferase [Yinghuangia seranimata]MDI2130213.1 GNAT family N-acetyltransferase [Yinghuangia seranimata]
MSAVSASALPAVVTDPVALDKLAPAWRELAASTGASYFATPDWVLSWAETLGAELPGRPLVAVWRGAEGEPQAVVPLLNIRQALHPRLPSGARCLTVLGAGAGAADHCGFAVDPRRADDVRAWFEAAARRHTLWLPNLDEATGAAYVPPGARLVERTACPTMPADPDTIGSARFRKDLRHYKRRLAAEGVTFRFVPPGTLDAVTFDALLGLHARRQEAIGRATTFDASRTPFHRALMDRAAPGRGPCAMVADGPDGPVGVLYGFLWGGTFSYYQTGWDPSFARLSLGTVLVSETVASVRDAGATVFDFLRGAEEYKYRFGAVDRHDTTWLAGRGLSGLLLGGRVRVKALRSRRAAAVSER